MTLTVPTVKIAFDLSLAGAGDFFTIGATPLGGTAVGGALPLAGDVLTSVSTYVRSITTRRGRSRFADNFDSGSATIVLDNRGRTFDPSATGYLVDSTLVTVDDPSIKVDGLITPYAASIKPRKAITVDIGGQYVFTGQVEDWDLQYDLGGDSVAICKVADGLALLTERTLTGGTAVAGTSGARVTTTLDDADWPTARRSIDTGSASLGADVIAENQNALDYLNKIAVTEAGSLFISREGLLEFRARTDLQTPTGTTFADDGSGIPFSAIDFEYGTERLYTSVAITYPNGTATATADAAALDDYGTSVLTVTTLLDDATAAQEMADYYAARYCVPLVRITGLEVKMHGISADYYDAVLARELGDLVTVKFTPNGIGEPVTQDLSIESIEHSITDGGTVHFVNMSLSDSLSGFIIGQSLLGVGLIGF